MLEGLVVFLAERAEGAGIPIPPSHMSSKVADTCAHLVNAAAYKTRKASEGAREDRDFRNEVRSFVTYGVQRYVLGGINCRAEP